MRNNNVYLGALFSAVLILLSVSSNAGAADYYFGAEPVNNHYVHFIDMSSRRIVGDNKISVWVTGVNNPRFPQKHPSAYDKALEIFDCSNNKVIYEEVVAYGDDGSVLGSDKGDPYATGENIVPDSTADDDRIVACATQGELNSTKFTHVGNVDILKYGLGFFDYVERNRKSSQ
jgi:hypothetical protein